MKSVLAAIAICLTPGVMAQVAAPTPKKNTFEGFGNTSLDRKPGGRSGQPMPGLSPGLPPRKATPSPATPTKPAPQGGTEGIALAADWDGFVAQAAGGQERKMSELRKLLSPYGSPSADTAAHPEVVIYEGPRLDGRPGAQCKITYLMPLGAAEAQLMGGRGMAMVAKAVAPGFPDGLFLHTYDIRAGIYNRLSILTDSGKPDQRVVAIVLQSESANYYPASPPFVKQAGDWHTHDYVNASNRGQGSIVIDTRVNDLRGQGKYIVVNTTGGFQPDGIPAPGIVFKPAKFSPKKTSSWHVPQPLINLILHCLEKSK